MSVYTLVAVEHHRDERYEALYVNGRFAAEPDGGGAFSASSLLEAVAAHDIGIQTSYVDLRVEYDEEVIAKSGWPKRLEEIPEEARA